MVKKKSDYHYCTLYFSRNGNIDRAAICTHFLATFRVNVFDWSRVPIVVLGSRDLAWFR